MSLDVECQLTPLASVLPCFRGVIVLVSAKHSPHVTVAGKRGKVWNDVFVLRRTSGRTSRRDGVEPREAGDIAFDAGLLERAGESGELTEGTSSRPPAVGRGAGPSGRLSRAS